MTDQVPVVNFDSTDQGLLFGDPELFEQVRSAGGIAWSERNGGLWVVASHELCRTVASDHERFRSGDGIRFPRAGNPMIFTLEYDRPRHTDHRRIRGVRQRRDRQPGRRRVRPVRRARCPRPGAQPRRSARCRREGPRDLPVIQRHPRERSRAESAIARSRGGRQPSRERAVPWDAAPARAFRVSLAQFPVAAVWASAWISATVPTMWASISALARAWSRSRSAVMICS